MAVVTKSQLENASADADDLAVIVNGNENTNVPTRYGGNKPTVAKLFKDILANPPSSWLSSILNSGLSYNNKGDPGPNGYAVANLSQLKAAPITDGPLNALIGAGDFAPFAFIYGNYTGKADNVNIIESNHQALSAGAWVRQGADNLIFEQTGTGALLENIQTVLRRTLWIESYLVNDGIGDQTAAFNDAIAALPASGGIVRFKGDYTVGTTTPIELPPEPKTVHLTGEGRLLQGAANAVMIRKELGVSRIFSPRIDGFTVVAHEDSDKTDNSNIAIEITGFDRSQIAIRAEGNSEYTSTTGRFHAVVAGHSNVPYCYGNAVSLVMVQTAGPAKGVWLHDNDAGTIYNANINTVQVYTYALDGCDTAVDCTRTTQTVVHDSLFEDCPGMVAVRAGNFTTLRDNWYELVETAIYCGSDVTTANNVMSLRDQFSGSNKIVIHSDVPAGPMFEGPLLSSEMEFVNQNDDPTTNFSVTRSHVPLEAPTISSLIIGGSADSLVASPRHKLDHHGQMTWHIRYSYTPVGIGRDVLRITCPDGYEVVQATVVATDVTVASPIIAGLSNALTGNDYEIWWPNTNVHTVNIRVTIRSITL